MNLLLIRLNVILEKKTPCSSSFLFFSGFFTRCFPPHLHGFSSTVLFPMAVSRFSDSHLVSPPVFFSVWIWISVEGWIFYANVSATNFFS